MAVGNIVDTADPEMENSDGEKVDDVYNHGGGFQTIEEKPAYVVAKDMTVDLLCERCLLGSNGCIHQVPTTLSPPFHFRMRQQI